MKIFKRKILIIIYISINLIQNQILIQFEFILKSKMYNFNNFFILICKKAFNFKYSFFFIIKILKLNKLNF
jgi:hypothetical protein